MQNHSQPKFRRLAIVTAVLATLPAAFAQQDKSDRVLPPPSLYDELMPADKAAGPAPAKPPAPQAAAAEPRAAQPKPAQPAPAKAATAEKVPAKSAESSEPWYKSMFSWFGGSSEPKPAQTKMMAAPSASPAATADATAARGEYAYYEANKVVRTGYGQCVKTGWWAATNPTEPCDPGMMAKKPAAKPTTVAAAAPAAAPRPEPVEVQPLAPAPVREERALEPEPVAAPVPAPAPVKPPVESVSLSADALFPLNSATLKPSAKERLDALASKMTVLNYKTIRVVGHTDPTGSPEFNEKLSRKRAEAVKQYLVSRGVDPRRIVTEGMGSAMPMVTEHDCSTLPRAKKISCYQPDRRVEVEVTGVLPRTGSAAQPSLARNQ